ncbi:MAG: hybrid sensor histidine kinase/response regulator [Rhodoferax sp.]|nr:hybrid sensor histidine kinase/response regulator [Rhodoferax sp.]
MAHCPAYQGPICSLCCTLDARCGDLCKPHAALSVQWSAALRWLLPRRIWPYLDTGLGHFILLMLVVVPLLATVFGLLYYQELRALALVVTNADILGAMEAALRSGFMKAYMALLVTAGIVAWWLVLAHKSRQVAQEESNRQTHLLQREIELHRQTDQALQDARLVAERARQAADQANQAKSRYISAISHELRTPLNSILGYAQLMGEDTAVPPHRQQAVSVIRRGGEHLLSLIEGTLDIAHIESGKLTLNVKPMRFADTMHEMCEMFEAQARAKGLAFRFVPEGVLPEVVRADEKRVRQILINLLGNAIKFTAQGHVRLAVRYARELALIEIADSGPGLAAPELARIFEPFARGTASSHATPGAGLGLTIAKMLTDLMGGEMTVTSQQDAGPSPDGSGPGAVFRIKLFLPELHPSTIGPRSLTSASPRPQRRGYLGPRRRLLVVDNEEADRELLVQWLTPIGFELRTAASGHDALDLLASGYRPDVVLMDLAMPGIDGWETIRRIRAAGYDKPLATAGGTVQPAVRIAIVSANAFDKALDNDVGIRPDDFIVKPVRHSELLDWLERQLALQWTETAPPAPAPDVPSGAVRVWPSEARLLALAEVVQLGYYRGVLNQLGSIETEEPACTALVNEIRGLARQFQFETIGRLLAEAPPRPHAAASP